MAELPGAAASSTVRGYQIRKPSIATAADTNESPSAVIFCGKVDAPNSAFPSLTQLEVRNYYKQTNNKKTWQGNWEQTIVYGWQTTGFRNM